MNVGFFLVAIYFLRHMVTEVEVTMWFFVVTYSVETICDKMGK